MSKDLPQSGVQAAGGGKLSAAMGAAALAASAALVLAFACRRVGNTDLGYHLAYGDYFLRHGRIVQTNRFIYARLDGRRLAEPDELGPGCRYDAQSETYHFVNANWLSQVIMAAADRAGGFAGLWGLQVALVAAVFAVLAASMRRWGLGPGWIALAVILSALIAEGRFILRPEVFGYLTLAGQFALLSSPRFTWRKAAGVIGLQVLAVNLHSYFLLGIALAGAMFADALLRWVWARARKQAPPEELPGRLKLFGAATAGAALASLANPWFLRGAVMPIQTLLAMREGGFLRIRVGEGARQRLLEVTEMISPFRGAWWESPWLLAYALSLLLAAAAAVATLLRRRWGWLAILVGIAAVSVGMVRNIGLAGIVLVPLSLIALKDGFEQLKRRRPQGGLSRIGPLPAPAASAVAIVLGGLLSYWVVSDRMYFSQRRFDRFGFGRSELSLPVRAAEWINDNKPAGRVFCDYSTSSNLLYLMQPPREVPVLSNTWAYPRHVLEWVLNCSTDFSALESAARQYDIGVVVLNPILLERPVIKALSASPDWAVVEIEPRYVVFLRREGANAALAARTAITEASFDVEQQLARLRRSDPLTAHAAHAIALELFWLGWLNPGVELSRRCLELPRGNFPEAARHLGITLAERALRSDAEAAQLRSAGRDAEARLATQRAVEDLRQALHAVNQALQLKPDYEQARKNLQVIRTLLARMGQPVEGSP